MGRNPDWCAAISALTTAALDSGLTEDEREALKTASAVISKRQDHAEEEAVAAYEQAVSKIKWPVPDGAMVIWSSMPPAADPAWYDALADHPEADMDMLEAMADEHAGNWLSDEETNLSGNGTVDLLCICDLGSWRGRRSAARIVESVTLPKALFHTCCSQDYDEYTVYARDRQICIDAVHHDATDHFTLYAVTNMDQLQRILDMPQMPGLQARIESDARTCIRSLYPDVAAVYGWPVDDAGGEGGEDNG